MPFFRSICIQQPLRCYRNDLVNSTVIVRIPCGLLLIVTWGLSHSIERGKIGQNLFSTGKNAFFSKHLLSTTSKFLQKWSCKFPSFVKILLDPFNLPLRFVTLDNARKKRPKYFLHWAGWLFFQKLVFSTIYFPQKWSYYFQSKTQTTFWTFTNRSLRFVTIDNRRKKEGDVFFFNRKIAFSQKICVSIKLLSP